MLVVKTPFRVSFFGGGTDFPEFYNQYGGSVISTTIDKYCYVRFRDLPAIFDYKNQLSYSKIEYFNDPDELNHPLVKAALKFLPTDRIQISYDADLPACSGMGSSSAFAVALLQGLYSKRNEYPDKKTLAEKAVYLERTLCGEAGGVQDQYAVSFGGFNRYNFNGNSVEVKSLDIPKEDKDKLCDNLILMFTGFTRFAGVVSEEQQKKVGINVPYLKEMYSLVNEAEKILLSGQIDDFGLLLNETWSLKRKLSSQISNTEIDSVYSKVLENGALGGKLLGAGGGGFFLMYVPKEKQESFKSAFSDYRFVPFSFEDNGTQIIDI